MNLVNGIELASKGGFMDRRSGAVLRSEYRKCLYLGIFLAVMALGIAAFGLYMDYEQSLAPKSRYVSYMPNNFQALLPMIYCFAALALLLLVAAPVYHRKMAKAFNEEREVYDKIRGFTDGCLSAGDFLAHRGTLRQSDFTGVYVLHNLTKDMYYVGQSVKVIDRVGQHFTGRGNADVYADFKYGDEFEISTVSLADSGYGSLNDLESDTIAAYDAYNNGYNKTAGNSR